MMATPRTSASPSSATAGPYLALVNDTPREGFERMRDLETPHDTNNDDAVVANAMESHSSTFAVCVGVFLAVGFLLVGYTDGLNSVISLPSFTVDRCTRTAVTPVRIIVECATIDARWFRLSYTIGSTLGPLLGGFALSDRFDRKWMVLAGALVSITGCAWAIGAPSKDAIQPVIARGVQGVGASILSFAIPLLMVEITSMRSRGLVSAVLFLGFYLGVFAWAVLKLFDDAEELRKSWQVLYVIPMVLAAVVGAGAVTFVPSSPRWLLRSKGASALFDSDSVPAAAVGSVHPSDSPRRSLFESYTLKRVSIAFVLLTAQQFFALTNLAQISNAFEEIREALSDTEIDYMTTSEMLQTGFNSNNGFVAFVVAIPAIIGFSLIDNAGRRPLLLSGVVLIGISQISGKVSMDACSGEIFVRSCRTNSSGANILILLGIAFFGLSWGPICIIYPFELFPTEVRARGTALAFAASTAVVMLIKEFYVELCFNVIALVAVLVLTLVVVALWCPETKKLALEDAEKLAAKRGLCSLN